MIYLASNCMACLTGVACPLPPTWTLEEVLKYQPTEILLAMLAGCGLGTLPAPPSERLSDAMCHKGAHLLGFIMVHSAHVRIEYAICTLQSLADSPVPVTVH